MSKRWALQFSTLLILTASFSVISGVLLLGENLQKILTLWGDSLQVSVYLTDDVTPDATKQIETTLKNNDQIEKVEFVPKQTALQQFREQMASYAPDLLKDDDLLKMIPSSFQFSLSRQIASEDQLQTMQDLASKLKVQPGVDDVSYGQEWVKTYAQIVKGISGAGLIFALIIVASAIFVISNCVRSSIHQRREEIEVLELIGATASYIRRPFLKEGILLCVTGSALGLAVTLGFFVLAKDSMKAQLQFLQLANQVQFLHVLTIAILLVGAAFVGYLASLACLKTLNDGWAASRKAKR